MNDRGSGITLIEVVIVIVILGILATMALPRLLNLSEQADSAAVVGVGDGLASAVRLTRAVWLAGGTGTAGNVEISEGVELGVNAQGWPVGRPGTSALLADQDEQCIYIWSNLMQNPPSIAAKSDNVATEWTAQSESGQCIFEYARDPSKKVVYTAVDGKVAVHA